MTEVYNVGRIDSLGLNPAILLYEQADLSNPWTVENSVNV